MLSLLQHCFGGEGAANRKRIFAPDCSLVQSGLFTCFARFHMRSKSPVSFFPSSECNKRICLVETRVGTHKASIHDALYRYTSFLYLWDNALFLNAPNSFGTVRRVGYSWEMMLKFGKRLFIKTKQKK